MFNFKNLFKKEEPYVPPFTTEEIFDYIQTEIFNAICDDGEDSNLLPTRMFWVREIKDYQRKEERKARELELRLKCATVSADYDDDYDYHNVNSTYGNKVNGGVVTYDGHFHSIPGVSVNPGDSTFANVYEERSKNY